MADIFNAPTVTNDNGDGLFHPLMRKRIFELDQLIAERAAAGAPLDGLYSLRQQFLAMDQELKKNPLTKDWVEERQLPPGVTDLMQFAQAKADRESSFFQKQGGYIDRDFIARIYDLPNTEINEANLSKLAAWSQHVRGPHRIILLNYTDLVPDELPGVRSPKNEELCQAVSRKILDHAPGYVPYGDRQYIARVLLHDGEASFFSWFDAGEIDENYGDLFSLLVRPTPSRNLADNENNIYLLTGIELEHKPFDENEILKLETLIYTHRLALNFRRYITKNWDGDTRPVTQLAQSAYATVNGIVAYGVMNGAQSVVADYLHMQCLSAAMRAMDGEFETQAGELVMPFVVDWLKQSELDPTKQSMPQVTEAEVFDAYREFASQIWSAGYRGHYTGMQRYEMTIRASAELLSQKADLHPLIKQIALGVLTAADKFNPSLVEKAIARFPQLSQQMRKISVTPKRPALSQKLFASDLDNDA